MTGATPALIATDLSAGHARVPAFSGLTFSLPEGASVAVIGPNGSGKSTLLDVIAGALRPLQGSLQHRFDSVAYLPQQLQVDPMFPITVRDVAGMGLWPTLRPFGQLGRAQRDRVDAVLVQLAIGDLADRRFSALSGGQRQRALLAQAIVQDAGLILLDEPYTGIDAPTSVVIGEQLRRWQQEGRTVLVSTHDVERARSDFGHTLVLGNRVAEFGTSEQIATGPLVARAFGDQPTTEGAGHGNCDSGHDHG